MNIEAKMLNKIYINQVKEHIMTKLIYPKDE